MSGLELAPGESVDVRIGSAVAFGGAGGEVLVLKVTTGTGRTARYQPLRLPGGVARQLVAAGAGRVVRSDCTCYRVAPSQWWRITRQGGGWTIAPAS